MIAGDAARVYLAFAAPGLFAAPLLRRAFPKLPDGGVSLARPAGWLIVSWIAWILPSLRIAPYGAGLVWVSFVAVAVAGIAVAWIDRREWAELFRRAWKTILAGELLALAVFALFVWQVQFNGDVHPMAERFMDYAILERIGLTRVFPPLDAWMAGRTLQYYYYGYVLMDVLRRLAGMELRWFFNLAIPGVFSAFALGAWGGGLALTGKKRAGLAAFAFAGLFGNFDFVRQIVLRGLHSHVWSIYPMDWFHASRVIDGTINEVPAFSVFWGDLHPYFIAFPLVAAVAAIAIHVLRADEMPLGPARPKGDRLLAVAFLALALGSLYPTNSWDFPTFSAVALAAVAWRLLPGEKKTLALLSREGWAKDGRVTAESAKATLATAWKEWLGDVVLLCGAIAVLSVVFYLPFQIGFAKQVGRGFRFAQRRSAAIPLMIHFAPWFLLMVGWAAATSRTREQRIRRLLPIPATFLVLALYELYAMPWVAGAVKTMIGHGGALAVIGQGVDHLFLRGLAFILVIAGLWTMLGDLEFDEVVTLEGAARVVTSAALGLVLVCEFVFLKDFYGGDNERMNTVFKAYIQAWILFGLGGSGLLVSAVRALAPRPWKWKAPFAAAATLVAVCSLAFILLADYTRSNRFHGTRSSPLRPTWDAELLFRTTAPADARAVDWIRENLPPDATLLELDGNAYEWPSRVSTFTGRLSLIGWKNHESGWRNSWDLALERDAVLLKIYDTPDLQAALDLLHKYGIEYVFVGELERSPTSKVAREFQLAKFEAWPKVYSNEAVAIYKVPDQNPPRAVSAGSQENDDGGR